MTDVEILEGIVGGVGISVLVMIAFIYLAMLAVLVFYVICEFKIFKKMDLPGWYCLIPFYGAYQQTKRVYGEGWWFLCSLIPIAGYAYQIKYNMDIARCFDFEWWFGLILSFLPIVGEPVMAFDKNHGYVCMHEGGPLTL